MGERAGRDFTHTRNKAAIIRVSFVFFHTIHTPVVYAGVLERTQVLFVKIVMEYNYRDKHYELAPDQFMPPPTLKSIMDARNRPKPLVKSLQYRLPSPTYLLKPSNVFIKDWKPDIVVSSTKPTYSIVYDAVKTIRREIVKLKQQLSKLNSNKYYAARSKANPYELIGKSSFVNRSAVKLAEINSVFTLLPGNSFTFLDLCGGPGGFAEYLLSFKSRGWGMTLKGVQDYVIEDQRFKRVYGDNSGNIYDISNINILCKQSGLVDLVVADGGFNVEGDEYYQEEHTNNLIICEALCALKGLKRGGAFVLKIFEFNTPVMLELIYLMYLNFEKLSVFKPESSRPGNNEKYLVMKGYVGNNAELISHLEQVVLRYTELEAIKDVPVSSHEPQNTFRRFEERIIAGVKMIAHIIEYEPVSKNTDFIKQLSELNVL